MRLEEGHSCKGNSMSKNREASSHSDRKRSSGERGFRREREWDTNGILDILTLRFWWTSQWRYQSSSWKCWAEIGGRNKKLKYMAVSHLYREKESKEAKETCRQHLKRGRRERNQRKYGPEVETEQQVSRSAAPSWLSTLRRWKFSEEGLEGCRKWRKTKTTKKAMKREKYKVSYDIWGNSFGQVGEAMKG